jgi:hypothetical protein
MGRDATGESGAGAARRRAAGAFALWLALFVLYTANRRVAGAGDTVPATLQAVAFARGDGPVLDRFDDVLRTPDGRLPGYAQDARGHVVSRYPIGPALVAAPLVAPQVWLLDAIEPGWERDRKNVRMRCNRLAKNAAAALVAGTAVVMLGVLRRLGLGAVATPAVAAAALGSGDLSVASQALWQHGPAAFCLAAAIALVTAGPASRGRLAGAGLAAALMVTCRPVDLPFAAALALWVLSHHDRPRRWAFFAPAALVAALLSAYHLYFFDTLTGGYAKIEQMHPWAHGVRGSWATPLLAGLAGTLASPSHGLFVYAPWVPLALVVLPRSWPDWARRSGPDAPPGESRSAVAWLLVALVPNLILLSKYSCWWGGHCFGARFWIDANPLFAIAMALGLDWSRRRARPLFALFALAVVAGVALNAVGWACYPSTWHGKPANADRHHHRLWDWRDNEVTRGLREGPKPPQW